MAQTGTIKHILVNLDAHRDVRTVMNHVIGEMVSRGYSETKSGKCGRLAAMQRTQTNSVTG